MTPPLEPMLLFMTVAASLFVLPWLLWWDAIDDDGVELRYDEERATADPVPVEDSERGP